VSPPPPLNARLIIAILLFLKIHESHQLDRQIYAIEREEQKTVASLKQAAKKNDKDVCKILAKSIVQLRRFFLLKSFSLLIIVHS
jgi:K+/H+ antiporter YhaU regulatory subunit KhtT